MRIFIILLCSLKLVSSFQTYISSLLRLPSLVSEATEQIAQNNNDVINEDSLLLVPALIEKYEYPVETHTVTTEDGFILNMHRIPRPGSKPVLLMHGLLDSSATWILTGPKSGLGYILYNLGYDVWMGNVRGNRYSRNHTELSVDDNIYWDFSFHEIGLYDLPVMVDFILNTTDYKQLHYVGHSQGTAIFWVMCSEKPEHCKKIHSMHALGPVAFINNMKSYLIRTIIPFMDMISYTTNLLGNYEFLPNNEILVQAGQIACHDTAITQSMCSNILFLFAGFNADQLNTTILPVILGHTPSGASTKQFIHFGQLAKSGHFRKYDYGFWKNAFVYNSINPSDYKLSNVNVPIHLYYAANDWLIDLDGVEKLAENLPIVADKYLIPLPDFNHFDYLWARDVKSLLYDKILLNLNKFQ